MTTPAAAARVKICGISDEAGLDAAIEAGASWVGFVFFARSPRAITPRRASVLHQRLGGRLPSVGLFVEPTDAELAEALATVSVDILQIYADAERAEACRATHGRPVWLARGVQLRADLPTSTGCDGLVIEAKAPGGSDRPGGNGARFDWSIAQGWSAPAPWLLAGGLTVDNVTTALLQSGAPAVDVSSGVERIRGRKDPELIRQFIAAAQGRQPAN